MNLDRPDSLTLAAFIVSTLFGGLNAIGVRFTVQELPPFWGGTVRFAPAALLLFAIALVYRLPMPSGRSLRGALVYGVLNFGLCYVFLYWGLQEVQPGMAQVLLALVPLLTLLFAILHGQETFRWRALLGSLLALGGVALVFGEQARADVPLPYLLAILLGAVCFAESGVLIKGYPRSHPVTTNGIGMATGALVLFLGSILGRETMALPTRAATWVSVVYLILFGSCAVFILLLFVLKRWTASATSYSFVLLPFVTVTASALLDQERLSLALAAGAALVLAEVYIGALHPAGELVRRKRLFDES